MTSQATQISAEAKMLIRKPVSQVFEAMVDPAITTNFWFTRSSGRVEAGKTITWYWDMYGVSADVSIVEVVKDEKIIFQWNDPPTTVEFYFMETKSGTYVMVRNFGFTETGDDLVEIVKDSTGGFTSLLDGMKAFLEFEIKLNLVADKYPAEIANHN